MALSMVRIIFLTWVYVFTYFTISSVLAVSVALGAVGVGAYPTSTTPAVVLYGILLAVCISVPDIRII